MFTRSIQSISKLGASAVRAPAVKSFTLRGMADQPCKVHGEHKPPSPDVVVPELVDTLEWILNSPPNVHQFDEPPIVVEIEHLKNLIGGGAH